MKKKLLTLMLVPALTLGSLALPAPQQAKAASSGEIIASVSFRVSPNTSAERIRYLKDGESVTILDEVNAWWYKVKDDSGRIGYISSSSKYIHTSGSSSSGSSDSTVSSGTGKIVSSVSFRRAADQNSSRIRYLQGGETVTILSKVSDWWYKVRDKNGTVGYVSTSSKYISVGGTSDSSESSGSSGSSGSFDSGGSSLSASEKARKVIDAGMKYLGTPYEYASSRYNTSTFDCSDFVRQAFLDGVGQKLPSSSQLQANYVNGLEREKTNWRELQPGDLMFFMSYRGSKASNYAGIDKWAQKINHVGIYLGDGKVLHTYSKDSGGVRIDSIEGKSWEYRYVFGGNAFQ